MKNYKPAMSFENDVAGWYGDHLRGDEDAAVAFLGDLAGGGPALELAIGTGRIALPLAARGIRVDGIDISPAMIDVLRAMPGGADMAVTVGDFADDRLRRLMIFAFAWLLFPMVFFSFSGSKLPGYILPILPAAALIVGRQLCRLRSDSSNWPLRTTAALYLLLAIVGLAYSWRTGNLPLMFALWLAAPLLAAGCFPFLFPRKPTTSVALMAATTVVVMIVTMYCAAPAFADRESSRRLLQLADARGYSQTVIFGMQRRDRTPEFYAAGRVAYGDDGEPIMYEGPDQIIDECRKRQDVLLAFVSIGKVNELTGNVAAQTEVIGSNARYAIVAVRAR